LRSSQSRSYSRTSQHFTEPGGSFPCSQQPSTAPYSESDPVHTNPSYLRSTLILSNHPGLGLPGGLLPSAFPTSILYTVLPIRATYPAHLILLHLIILIILGQVMKLLNVPLSPTSCHFISLQSSIPCSQTPSVYVRFEVFTAVTMKNDLFWYVEPCRSCVNRALLLHDTTYHTYSLQCQEGRHLYY
jgi:hypothetical protein